MNLHEYQAKELIARYGVPKPHGVILRSLAEMDRVAAQIEGDRYVVKAQVHAGGRGKAGGVRLVKGRDELEHAIEALLGTRLVTHQTDEKGQPIDTLLIESPSAIKDEYYLSMLVDRESRRVIIMASTEGGMDIEEVAEKTPEKIIQVTVDPTVGLQGYQARELFFKMGLDKTLLRQFVAVVSKLYKAFIENDMAMLEINPLVRTEDDQVICLDCKICLDENALFRHQDLAEMRDTTQDDPREVHASQWELNYIPLDGNIACMVNGAGLAMATMDIIKLYGGVPANFLDVGGSATEERVKEAFKIIVSDSNVKGIFVNIFGGIVRCDMIAEGIIKAVEEVGINIPVVVRLQGNCCEEGAEILAKSDLSIVAVNDLTEAAKTVTDIVAKAG